MTLDDNGLEVLDTPTCRSLLGATHLGRVALSHQALPIIVPVVYTLVGEQILIPAASSLVRNAAQSDDVVCFEADAQDANGATWSVLVTGRLSLVGPTARRDQTGQRNNGDGEVVGLKTSMISGRRTTTEVGGLNSAIADHSARRS